jgi:hypothetical protein
MIKVPNMTQSIHVTTQISPWFLTRTRSCLVAVGTL